MKQVSKTSVTMIRDVLERTEQIMSERLFKINRDFPITQGGRSADGGQSDNI